MVEVSGLILGCGKHIQNSRGQCGKLVVVQVHGLDAVENCGEYFGSDDVTLMFYGDR